MTTMEVAERSSKWERFILRISTRVKSTEDFIKYLSFMSLALSFYILMDPSQLWLGLIINILAFILLYLSNKTRKFIIYPKTLIYTENRTYKIMPWNPEGETRWDAYLKRLDISVSNSLKLKNTKIYGEEKTFNHRRGENQTTYSFVGQLSLDVNFSISFNIERCENVEDERPYLQYTIIYKYKGIPFLFWDSRRIF